MLVSGVDFLPIGRSDLGELTDTEAGILLRILMTSDHKLMYQSPRPEGKDEVLESLVEKGYIRLDEALVYLNFENDLFKHFLAKDSIYNITNTKSNTNKVKPKKKNQPPKPKTVEEHLNEKRWQDRVSIRHQQVLDVINEGRKEIGVNPLVRWSEGFEQSISNALRNFTYEEVLKVVRHTFNWDRIVNAEVSFKNKMTQPQKIFGGDVKGKLYYANQANVSVEDIDVKVEKSQKDDVVSQLFNTLLDHWNEIQNQKVKIELVGDIRKIQITSLAVKIFRKKTNGQNPKFVNNAENVFRECFHESKQKGGLLSTSSDDLNINGELYSVPSVSVEI